MASASRIRRLFGKKSAGTDLRRRPGRHTPLHLESLDRRIMLSGITYQVNTFNDTNAVGTEPVQGTDQNGQISLRSAIEATNYDEGEFLGQVSSITIDLPGGNYNLSLGELDLIPDGIPVLIAGQGLAQSVINAQQQSRVLEIQQGFAATQVTLENVELENGTTSNSGALSLQAAVGAGILDNLNPLSLQNVTLAQDEAIATDASPNAWGGAIYDFGAALSITDSTIANNFALSNFGGQTLGGGIYDDGGNFTLTSSTVESNVLTNGTVAAGAGIYSIGANDSISGSTIEANGAHAGAAATNTAGYSAQGGGLFFGSGPIPYPPPAGGNSLSIQNSQITDNTATGGAGGAGSNATTSSTTIGGPPAQPPQPGQPGGSAYGGGVYIEGGQAHIAVTITNSSVSGNSATGGIGGAGGGGRGSSTASAGGSGGSVLGAGISMNDPKAILSITSSTISQNVATGGQGGAGGSEYVPSGVPAPPIGAAGGTGGVGGSVEGVGASVQAGTVTVTGTTFQSNDATGGAGGAGGLGFPGLQTSGGDGGDGGNGGSGGGVFGAALYVPAASSNGTADTFSALLIQNNSSTGGAGGAGASGSAGGNFSLQGILDILDDIAYVPYVGVAADVGIIIVDAVRATSTSQGAAGGDGGFGGAGGNVGAALVIGGGNTLLSGTAIVQNSAQAGVGGNGGAGGNGGDNDDGAGGYAGNGGAAGVGGFVYGAGFEEYGGVVTVADTTIDSNTATAGMGGAFGVPGTPGDQQTVSASDFFFPALNIALAVTGFGIGGTAGHALEGAWALFSLSYKSASYFTTSQFAYPQFLALTPSITGATAQTASAAVSGVAGGGGVYAAGGTLNLINDTITRNTSGIAGGVYTSPGSTVDIGNTIIAQNTARSSEPDVYAAGVTSLSGSVVQPGELTSLGHNLIGALSSAVADFQQAGDMSGTPDAPLNPDLGPLQLNGGTTLNREPQVDSPVLGGGNPSLDTEYSVTTDQTGLARTIDGTVDIGADEGLTGLLGATLLVNSSDGTENPTNVLTLAEAVALSNGSLAYSQLTQKQQAQVSKGTGSGPDTIEFASALAGQTIDLSTEQASFFGPTALAIDVPVTIVGPSGGLTISRAAPVNNLRLFDVARTGQLTLENLTLSQGLAVGAAGASGIDGGGGGGGGAGMGGAVLNFGALSIQSSTLSGNAAEGGAGGASGATLGGQYLSFESGGPGGGPFPGLANQSGGLGTGGGGASFADNAGGGGLGGGGGGSANAHMDAAGYTSPGAGGLGGGGGSADRSGGGGGAGLGGAIFNLGSVTITGSTLSGNAASGGKGAGSAGSGSGLGGALFNDDGTVTVSASSFTSNTATQGAGIVNLGDGQSGGFPVQTATVTLTGSTLADPDGAPDYKAISINGGTTNNPGRNDLFEGVPSGTSPLGSTIALTSAFTDPGSAAPTTDLSEVWQVSDGAGQTVAAAQNLTFTTPQSPVTLPSGLIQNDTTTLTVQVTFQTTKGGVILGYQDQAVGTAPANFVPALYVGANGLLYAEIYNGTIQPIQSQLPVNDGQQHTAVLTLSGDTETLTLDGVPQGILSGASQPLDMSFDQIGTGDTANWPGGNGGIYPFNGTISQITVTGTGPLASAGYSGSGLSFTGTGPVALPSGLISSAPAPDVSVTFQTTADGVILGYQDQLTSATPDQYMPALYVGSNGLLYAEIFDGSFRQMVSTTKVNDGKPHTAELIDTGTAQSLYVDGALVATLDGTPVPLSMNYDQLGTGYTLGYPNTTGGYFPFSGTIDKVVIGSSAAWASSVSFSTSGGNQITFAPPAPGTATIAIEAFDQSGDQETASQTLVVPGMNPIPSISGLPGSVSEGTPITLTASATDPSTADQAAGFDDLWQISAGTGQETVAGQGLSFNGTYPVALPSGLISAATTLTVNVTFQTTADGVILGYQNQPTTATPSQYMPALYVGTNGLLYAEIFDGTFRELSSSNVVDDGQTHTAELIETGTAQSLYLDGTLVGTLSGTPNPLDMTYDQLGTGYTLGHPNAPAGYFPWSGTIDSIQITQGNLLAGSLSFPATSSNQLIFTPPDAGTYSIILSATDIQGNTGTQTVSLSVVDVPINVNAGSTTVVVQGSTFTGSGSFTDVPADGPWSATVNYGDGTGSQPLALNANQTFNLSHLYANAGLFTVTVTVTNQDGVAGTGSFNATVWGFTVNDGSPQQSMVKSLTYTFPTPTEVEPGAFELYRNGKRSKIDLQVTPLSNGMTYLITFSGPGVVGGSVPDGDYTLITLHNLVQVLSGPSIVSNDVNTFVRKRYKGRMDPPAKAPPKFPGRKVPRHVARR
jgi:hypothetical protein